MNYLWLFNFFCALFLIKKVKLINFYVKLIGCYFAVVTIVSLYIPYFLLRPRNVENLKKVGWPLRYIAKFLGLKFKINGSERLSKEEPGVVVANHQSSIDIMGIFEFCPSVNKISILAKRELLYLGTYGIAAWLAGMIFINRSAGVNAGKAMNDAMMNIKKKNAKLWIFPEGTRRNTGEIHEFKKGAFHAAIHAQVPIIPVVYSPYKHVFDEKKKLFSEGEIFITVLPEISTIGLTASDVDGLIEKTRNAMMKVYKESKMK